MRWGPCRESLGATRASGREEAEKKQAGPREEDVGPRQLRRGSVRRVPGLWRAGRCQVPLGLLEQVSESRDRLGMAQEAPSCWGPWAVAPMMVSPGVCFVPSRGCHSMGCCRTTPADTRLGPVGGADVWAPLAERNKREGGWETGTWAAGREGEAWRVAQEGGLPAAGPQDLGPD